MKSYFYEETLKKKLDLFGDFRLRERKKLHVWLWSSITIFILLVASVATISAVLYAWRSSVARESLRLKNEISVLRASLKTKQTVNKKLLAFLQNIPSKIPANTWLESIECEAGRCALRGNSFDAREVRGFCQKYGGRLKHCARKGDFVSFSLEIANSC